MKKAGIRRKQSLLKNFILRNKLISDDIQYKLHNRQKSCNTKYINTKILRKIHYEDMIKEPEHLIYDTSLLKP